MSNHPEFMERNQEKQAVELTKAATYTAETMMCGISTKE